MASVCHEPSRRCSITTATPATAGSSAPLAAVEPPKTSLRRARASVSAWARTSTESELVAPRSSVTVSVAVYRPGAAYSCVTDSPEAVAPSPKSQSHETIVRGAASDPEPSNVTVSGAWPRSGVAVADAGGAAPAA